MYGAWCTLNLVQSLILCRGPLWSNRVYKRFIVRQLSHTRHSTNDETKSVPKHFSHERTIIDVATLSIIVYFDDSLSSTNFYRGGVAKSAEKETNGKKRGRRREKKKWRRRRRRRRTTEKGASIDRRGRQNPICVLVLPIMCRMESSREWHATSIRIATMLRYASRSNLPGV